MHAVTFQIKRAHWSGVAFGKKALAKKLPTMTPARFDLLYAIRQSHSVGQPSACFIYQDELRGQLGLHASTVSKLIKRLVELGWVTNKDKPLDDRRTRVVRLTREGLAKIDRAIRILFRQRIHLKHFEDLFRGWNPDIHVLEAIDDFWTTIDEVARKFGDTSTLRYSFGYDPDP
jgi:DNA-binding MarR family transcriptional regulator